MIHTIAKYSDENMIRGSAGGPDVFRGEASSNYMQTVCGKCKEPMSLIGLQIDFMAVCRYCYELHQISSNRLPCPYKRVKSRKLPVKPTPMIVETTHAQSNH